MYGEKRQQDCIMCKFFHLNVYLKAKLGNHHTENMLLSLSLHCFAHTQQRLIHDGASGEAREVQLCIWKLDWAHDTETLGRRFSHRQTQTVDAFVATPKRREGAMKKNFPTLPSSLIMITLMYHSSACLERHSKAALDARHTHTHFSHLRFTTRPAG
jgi:hypothetical protein